MKSQNIKHRLYLFFTLVFVYLILFEFILPINKVLPKPSILWESFTHLWTVYNIGIALISTIGVVYFSIGVGFFLIWLLREVIIRVLFEYKNSIQTLYLFRYFPPLFFVILFSFWFNASVTAKFVFSSFAFIFLIIRNIYIILPSVKEEYLLVAENLNPSKKYSEISWHSILPELFNQMKKIHYNIWALVLLYEFISNTLGLGNVYRSILEYNDFGALISMAIIVSIFIWLGSFMIQYLKNKLAFWKV